MPSQLASIVGGPNPGLQSMSLPDLAGLYQRSTDPREQQMIQQEMLRRHNAGQNVSPTFGNPLAAPGVAPVAPPVGNLPVPPPQPPPGAAPVLPRLNPTSSPAGPSLPPSGAPAYGMAAQAPQPGPMDANIMSAPPPGPSGDMPTYDQRMDQASMPAGQVAQGGSSLPIPLDKPPAPAVDSLPIPMSKPPQPGMGIEGGWQDGKQIAEQGAKPTGKRRVAAKVAPPTDSSESDALNNQQVALAIAQRLAGNRAQG